MFAFLGMFVVFLAAFVANVDFSHQYEARQLVGMLLHAAVVIVTFIVGVFSKALVVDTDGGTVEVRIGILNRWFPFTARALDPSAIDAVALHEIRLVPDSNDTQRAKPLGGAGSGGTSRLYKLLIRMPGDSFCVEHGTFPAELEKIGKALARQLGVPYRTRSL
jgi:hypothetical protein